MIVGMKTIATMSQGMKGLRPMRSAKQGMRGDED
jgi:hypothetical protein